MSHSLVVLCSAAFLLFQGVSSSTLQFPDIVTAHKTHKREVSAASLAPCVGAELGATFRGNSSQFVSECKLRAGDLLSTGLQETLDSQTKLELFFDTFCVPDCGNAVLRAYRSCGLFAGSLGLSGFLRGLCGTNYEGVMCYEISREGREYAGEANSCYGGYSGECTCRSELEDGVMDQGCCLNVYYDYFAREDNIFLKDIYKFCGVNLPGRCNNSPLNGTTTSNSNTLPTAGVIIMMAAVFVSAMIEP